MYEYGEDEVIRNDNEDEVKKGRAGSIPEISVRD